MFSISTKFLKLIVSSSLVVAFMHTCRSKLKHGKGKHIEAGQSSSKTSSKPKGPAGSSTSFKIIPARFLHEKFFRDYCHDIIEIIAHYQLATIMFCSTSINVDLVAEFYDNLHCVRDDPLLYRSRVAKRDLDFSPAIWRSFLGCRPADNAFVCYPTLPQPLVAPFDHLSLDLIFEHFFRRPRPPLLKYYSSQGLSAPDNVLYKVIIGCLLPVVTRDQAYVRFNYLFLMYALRHRLDVDIGLNMFHCIVHFTKPVKRKLHMPFPHLITAWFASLGIDVARDGANIEHMTDSNRIGLRNFALAGMRPRYNSMEWASDHDDHEDELGPAWSDMGEEPAGSPEMPDPVDTYSDDSALYMEEYMNAAFGSLDSQIQELRLETMSRLDNIDRTIADMSGSIDDLTGAVHQLTTMFHSWMSSHPPPPPPAASGGGSAESVHPRMDEDF